MNLNLHSPMFLASCGIVEAERARRRQVLIVAVWFWVLAVAVGAVVAVWLFGHVTMRGPL